MFKDLQQQHVWLWPWHSHWNHQLAVGGGQQHTVTNILSFCLQTGSTEKLSAMVLATPTAKQMNDWIEEVCSLTFTSCEGYNTPQLHQVMTQDMHIQSHQEKKWGCYFSDVSSFKQQGLRGEREILLIKAWFPVASKWSCSNFRNSCTYSISQSTVYGATDS
jgi:hypothetical protein